MPRIYVKFSGLQQLETTCSDASATLSEIQSDFQKTVRQLDWDVRLLSDINRTASRLSGKLSSYTAALKKYQSFLNDAHSAYQELDVYQGLAFATPDPDQTTSYGFDWKEMLASPWSPPCCVSVFFRLLLKIHFSMVLFSHFGESEERHSFIRRIRFIIISWDF